MSNPPEPARAARHSSADFVFETFVMAGIAGTLVAVFFLFVDLIRSEPLFTPSLMGSVLFLGMEPEAVTEVRLDMVAWYSCVHFASFLAFGALIAFVAHEAELHARHPVLLLFGVFLLVEAAFFIAATLWLPGVVAVVGRLEIAIANLMAAGGMVFFLVATHRPQVWDKVKRGTHMA